MPIQSKEVPGELEFKLGLKKENKGQNEDAFAHFITSAALGNKEAQEYLDKKCAKLAEKGNLEEVAKIYQAVATKTKIPDLQKQYMEKIEAMYIKAAENGNQDAAFALAEMYEQGKIPGAQNKAEALKWYHKAANLHQGGDQNVDAVAAAENLAKQPPDPASNKRKADLAKLVGFERLMPIIANNLTGRIRGRDNNKSSDKVKLLEGVSKCFAPQANSLDFKDTNVQAVMIALCQEIVKIKRHSLDPRAPKSVKEYNMMLGHSDMKVDPKIKFTKKEIKQLLKGKPEELPSRIAGLVTNRATELQPQKAEVSPGAS